MDFYSDKEKGVVVAVIENARGEMREHLFSKLKHNTGAFYEEVYAKEKLKSIIKARVPATMRAKAKCSPNDVWNEEFGVALAKARILEKYNRAVVLVLDDYSNFVSNNLLKKLSNVTTLSYEKYNESLARANTLYNFTVLQ